MPPDTLDTPGRPGTGHRALRSPPPASSAPDPRRARLARLAHRPVLAGLAAVALVLAIVLVGFGATTALGGAGSLGEVGDEGATEPLGQWHAAASPTPEAPPPSPSAVPAPDPVSLSATGDIIMGDAGSLPADDGAGFFEEVAGALEADLVMGNLEQPLTEDTGFRKCEEGSTACHAFRAPPHYAGHLSEAGFELMNLANNHGNDFGPDGRANTQAALDQQGIAHTGARDQITVAEVAGTSVAVVGFSAYEWTNDLNDHDQARGVVTAAAAQADLVVVQVHMGAEGSDATRVRPGPEIFYDENRGDPMAFSRAVIDAGADLVVGHGPHVLRGLEFYEGRLIAYSLGNFAGGGGTLRADGDLGLGAVLKVRLHPDGGFAGGELVSTHMYDAGLPTVDPQQRSLDLVRDLTGQDFPDTGAVLGPGGEITPP